MNGKIVTARLEMPVGISRDEICLDGIFGESGRMLKKKWRRVKRHLHDKWMPDYLKANLDMDPSKRCNTRGSAEAVSNQHATAHDHFRAYPIER